MKPEEVFDGIVKSWPATGICMIISIIILEAHLAYPEIVPLSPRVGLCIADLMYVSSIFFMSTFVAWCSERI
jgi:hypothetical protein